MWLIYIIKSIFCIKLIFCQENDIFRNKILEKPVKDRTQEDEEEVMIPILKVVLIAGHLSRSRTFETLIETG